MTEPNLLPRVPDGENAGAEIVPAPREPDLDDAPPPDEDAPVGIPVGPVVVGGESDFETEVSVKISGKF